MKMRRILALIFVSSLALPGVALAAPCDAGFLSDQVCDCGCDAVDPACPADAKFDVCERSHCSVGSVPWEHDPEFCMDSACGDGWNDTVGGEVCDDGNALNSGGCAATCTSVNTGYVCGAGASGCMAAPPDAGLPDAGPSDSGAVDAGMAGKGDAPQPRGCSVSGPGTSAALAMLALLLHSRARARRKRTAERCT